MQVCWPCQYVSSSITYQILQTNVFLQKTDRRCKFSDKASQSKSSTHSIWNNGDNAETLHVTAGGHKHKQALIHVDT